MHIVPISVISALSGISLQDVYDTIGTIPLTQEEIADRILWRKPIGELRAAIFDVRSVGRHLETLVERGHAVSEKTSLNEKLYLTPQGETASSQYL